MEEYTGEVIPLSSGLKPYDGDIIPVDSTSARSKFAATDSRRVDIPKGIIASNIQSDDNPDTGIDGIQSMPFVPTSESNQAAVRRVDNATDAAPQTSGSVVKDVGVNLAGGAVKGLSDFGKVINTVIGRNDAVQSADDLNSDVSQWQKENGGDTFYGKVSDMVGAIVPTLAVGEGKLVQFAVNAGWFGIPAFQKTLDSELEQGTDPATAGVRAIRDFAVNMVLPDAAKFGGSKLGAKLGTDAMGAAGKVADTALAAPVMGGLDVATQVAGNASNVAEGKDSKDIDWERAAVAATGASALHAVPHALGAGADLARTASDEAMWRINPQAQAARELARGMDDTSLNAPDLNTGIVQNQYVSDQGANGKIGDANLPVQYEQGTAINPNLTRPTPDDVLKTNSVDDAITVSNASLPDVTVDTSKPGIADALGKIRPIDTTIQDKLEREEYDSLDQKSKGYTDDTGNTVQPASLDVNEQRRYDELAGRVGADEGAGVRVQPEVSSPAGEARNQLRQSQQDYDSYRQRVIDRATTPEERAELEKDTPAIQFNEPPPEVKAQTDRIAEGVSGLLGIKPESIRFYEDQNPENPNGVFQGGVAHVNTSGLTLDATQTGLHEAHHVIESIAASNDRAGLQNTPAQKYRDATHGIFDDLSDQGKRNYIANFLFKPELTGITNKLTKMGATPAKIDADRTKFIDSKMDSPILKSEMAADFVGNRHNDKDFLKSLAQADPTGFKSVVSKWLNVVGGMLNNLRGTGKNKESLNVDSYLGTELQKHKDNLRQALIDIKRGGMQGLDPLIAKTGDVKQSAKEQSGQSNFEVAPDPNDKELSDKWNALPADKKLAVSERIAERIVPKVLEMHDASGRIVSQTGSYLNDTNPSFALRLTSGDLHEVSKSLGHVLSQDSMMNISRQPFAGSEPVGAVSIELGPKSHEQVKAIYDKIRAQVPEVGGQSFTGKEMVVLNYSDMASADLAKKIDAALGSEYPVTEDQYHSSFPEKKDYDYGSSTNEPGAQSASGRGIREGIDRIRAEASDAIRKEINGPDSAKFSAREDYYNPGEIDHLGSFDLDRDYAESSKDKFDFPDLSKADKKLDAAALTPEEKAEQFRQDIAEELHDSGFSVSGTPKQATSTEKNFAEVKPADLKKAGFMPESAYPDLEYKDFPNGDKRAFFVVNGERYKASLNGVTQRPELDTSAIAKNAKGTANGNMVSYELTGLSEQAKKDWNKRFAASADLFHRGFDLFTSVPSKARENILSVWKKIAENPDAFEFAKADKATGKTVKEVAQSVADQMMKDSRYEVEIVGPKEHRGTADFGIKITDTKTGVDGFADVEFHQRDKEVTMHVQDLEKGSSMGKPIYQIGQAFADKFKARMEADPQGLLGVNNYRRTEQAFSGALRSGNFDTMQPGIGQRIYGWNERAKTPEQQERNFVRMALASTRNALEFVPDIKNFGYDMATDKFYFKDRPRSMQNDLIAGNKIKTMLEDKDARVGSISRSTLARAAVTLDAIDGKTDVPGKIAKPVLYSKKQGPEELKYEHNYLVPEINGFKDGKVAQMPPVLISKDGISRNFPSMPVRIRVGEHQRDEKFNEQYGLQHRIENRQQYEYRGYQTPDIGKDSTAEVERASRDIALGVLTGKTVYADNSGSKIYLHSPEQNRMTVLQKETDSEGNPFWNVKSSMPQTNEQMMGKFKAPTSINGSMVDGTRTQQSSGILTGILNKLKEPGSFLASSESYSLDEGNRLFKSTVAETPKLQSPARVLARDENGKIILNKNKADTTYSKRELPGEEMLGKVQTHLSDLIDHGMEKSGVYNALAPMSAGTQKTRALAQAWINSQRKADYQWNKIDETITKNFTPEQRTKMWNAADEQNELLATGQDVKGKGIDRLTPEERATVEGLRGYGEELLKRAKDVGMFKGDGVPYWTPRMMAMVDESGEYSKPGGEGQQASSSGTGRNLTTSSSNLKQRKYLTSAETEAAMQAKGGELVRDIRTMPLAMGKLEKAIAGRELVNQIKQLGHATGTEMVSDHAQEGFFTLDHPSFQTFKPRLEKDDEGKWHVLNDENGNPIFEKTPIYISNDFKGPLKAILSEQSHPAYSAYMLLKSKAMSAIMFSPLIHQQVILGRALAYGGLKTPMFYWTGNAAKKDFDFMQKMIGSGMVPIGNHNNMLDVGDLARGIGKTGGYGDLNESWVGLGARDISNSLSKMLGGKGEVGDVIKSGIDKAGDFWHNTLLWNRVGDLQAGIAKDVYDKLIAKGADENAATTVAAHIANRYAGAVGKEAMSDTMHRAANILLFSKSFNAGNVGSVKDTFYGLPAGLKAQLFEGSSPEVAQDALSFAKSKARWGLVKDLAAALIITSLVQDWFKRNKDAGWKEQLTDGLDGYQKRLADAWTNAKENPLSASSYNPYRLSSTHVNEPGKEERVDMGAQPNSGRHEYMRLPTGKVIEDLIGWTLHPVDTFGKKLSPLASTIKGLSTNDKNSFGTPIFDPSDTTMHKAMDVAKYLVGKQMPMDQIETGIDAYKGKATQLDKDKLEGNMTGLTISQGHPQGPEAGVAAKVEERVKASKAYTLEFVKHDLKYDNVDKARERLEGIGLTPRETTLLINRLQNPHDQMSGAQRKKFNQHASDEDRKTMDEVNQ